MPASPWEKSNKELSRQQALCGVSFGGGGGGEAFQSGLGLVGFCGLILGHGQGLVGFCIWASSSFLFLCRVELNYQHLEGLETAVSRVWVRAWPLAPGGAYNKLYSLLGTCVSQFFRLRFQSEGAGKVQSDAE